MVLGIENTMNEMMRFRLKVMVDCNAL